MRDFVNHLPPTEDSALFREQNPRSWWWTAEIDFMAAILHTLQLANWQRAGKGPQPKPVKRPDDSKRVRGGSEPKTVAELAERRKLLKAAREVDSG